MKKDLIKILETNVLYTISKPNKNTTLFAPTKFKRFKTMQIYDLKVFVHKI